MTALDFSADIGLVAVFLGTTNICLGQLIAVRYSPCVCGLIDASTSSWCTTGPLTC
jgi:hypothetical protein